jgi:GxxExxY protein
MEEKDKLNLITRRIIRAAIEVHRYLGPGLLSLPTKQVSRMSGDRGGYKLEQQKPLPVVYKDVKLDCGCRLDLVVEDKVIVEVKAIERLAPIHDAQRLSYLRVSGKSVGLIINFPVRLLKNGLNRIVNEFPDSARSAASKKAENSSNI